MAFVRWNQSTQIWEVAVTPENPATLFNHLPISNPTLPLDTANKQYVDSLVGGGPFVPYTGATGNVNLGAFDLLAARIYSVAPIASGPTLGSYANTAFTVNANSTGTHGLGVGVSPNGDIWTQVQRFDGGVATYNILLNPAGGKVGIGILSPFVTLHVRGLSAPIQGLSSAYCNFALESTEPSLAEVGPAIVFLGQSGNAVNPYPFARILGAKASSAANNYSGFLRFYLTTAAGGMNTVMSLYDSGSVVFTGPVYERNRPYAMGDWIPYTPIWGASGTQPTLGNSLISGHYTIIGRTCYFHIFLQINSTATFGSGYHTLSLPLPFTQNTSPIFQILYQSGNAFWSAHGIPVSQTAFYMLVTSGEPHNDVITPIYPTTMAIGNRIYATGFYEIF